jgi:hypothetical protein
VCVCVCVCVARGGADLIGELAQDDVGEGDAQAARDQLGKLGVRAASKQLDAVVHDRTGEKKRTQAHTSTRPLTDTRAEALGRGRVATRRAKKIYSRAF